MNDNEKYLEKLKTHRRHLHQIPEIDRDLPETKAYLLSVLEQLDCELTFLCGSGICAWFDSLRWRFPVMPRIPSPSVPTWMDCL